MVTRAENVVRVKEAAHFQRKTVGFLFSSFLGIKLDAGETYAKNRKKRLIITSN
jgi:hypothetical protein